MPESRGNHAECSKSPSLGADDRMTIKKPLLATACICILCGILIAGLWPFFPPKNDVHWLSEKNGLAFGNYGTALSSADLIPQGAGSSCTIEVWLQPAFTVDSNTFLDIYKPTTPFLFRMRQSGDDLVLLRNYRNDRSRRGAAKLYVDHVFRQDSPLLITIAANGQETSVYLDGQLAKSTPFGLTREDLHGRLIMGAAPESDDRWSGKLLGVGVYDETLSPEQVLRHYRWWNGGESLTELEHDAIALYTFSERTGSVVHSQVRSGPDLEIPRRFLVVGQAFLMPPWDEFSPGWSYYKDLLINIAGFLPFGFVFCAYLSGHGRDRRALVRTILIGAATSLTIEVLQAFIPTRQSGMTDLITNTLGTGLGAMLFQYRPMQELIDRSSALLSPEKQIQQRTQERNNPNTPSLTL
jgi:VanZ family protein